MYKFTNIALIVFLVNSQVIHSKYYNNSSVNADLFYANFTNTYYVSFGQILK